MTIRLTLSSLVGGEVSDDELGFRSDWGGYQNSLKRVENFLCTPAGRLTKRGGWERIAQHDACRRLIPFEFSISQTYLFSMGNGSCTVYRGDTLASVATFSIPWSDAQLPFIRWAGQGDTLVVVHEDVHPKTIKRGGSHSSWSVADLAFSWPIFSVFPSEYDSTISIASDNAGVGATYIVSSAALFDATWVGRYIEMGGGYMLLDTYTNNQRMEGTIIKALNRRGNTTLWKQNAISAARGYPRAVTFYQGRLFFGGTKTLPSTIFGSRTGDYFNFNSATDLAKNSENVPITDSLPKAIASDSLTFSVTSERIVTIVDLVNSKSSLGILTNSGEFVETSKPIAPDSISFTRTSNVGMSTNGIRALSIDSDVLFVSRNGDELRSFSYALQSDQYQSENLSTVNPTIINQPVDSSYVRGLLPASTHAFFANADGGAGIMCIDAMQKVRGWSRMVLPTGALIKNLCTLADTNIYALIEYNAHRYICRLSKTVHLDLFESATSTAKTSWTGFTTFANKTVSVVGDGYVFNDIAVNGSGNFTLPFAVASIKVGLAYSAVAETLTLAPVFNGQLQRGRVQVRKIAAEVVVRDTADIWVDGKRIPQRQLGNSLLNQPPTARDATFRTLLSGIGREPTVKFESRDPLPCSIIGAVIELKGPGLG